MKKTLFIFLCVFSISTFGECGVSLKNIFRHNSTNQSNSIEEVTTNKAIVVESSTAEAVKPLPANYFKSNTIPKIEKGCEVQFMCVKKLKQAEVPKPCVKFCIKNIKCKNGTTEKGKADECIELNEELVAKEYNQCDETTGEVVKMKGVAMIDFPCQPGYLPDSRGRCREVW